jgi:hypothetical protein
MNRIWAPPYDFGPGKKRADLLNKLKGFIQGRLLLPPWISSYHVLVLGEKGFLVLV